MRIDSSYFRLLIYLNARRPISQISFIVSKGHTQPVTFWHSNETSGIGWRGRRIVTARRTMESHGEAKHRQPIAG
jgi:hypothetical protein